MATIYVSKRSGNNSNNGTTTSTPVADLWKAFDILDIAGDSDGDTIEVIDSETYYVIDGNGSTGGSSGSLGHISNGSAAYPPGTDAVFHNFTLKAGTDLTTDSISYPVISGKFTNESGSASMSVMAFAYQEGWTIEGFEIRDFTSGVAIPDTGVTSNKNDNPDSVAGDPSLIIKDCLIHHIQDRNTGGNANGTIAFTSDTGDETTNIVENCIFYEIGKTVIGGASEEDVLIKNCLIVNYSGAGSSHVEAINLKSSGSVVEHCIIANQQNDNQHNDTAVHLNDLGEIRFTIVSHVEGNNEGVFRSNQITSCISHESTRPGSGANVTSGSSTHKLFNANGNGAVNAYDVAIDDCTADPTLIWNSSSTSAGYMDSGQNGISSEEIGNFLNIAGTGMPPFYFTTGLGDGPDQASGSTSIHDLSNTKWFRSAFEYPIGRVRTSTAASCAVDIGCFEFFKTWSENNRVTDQNITDNFTINNSGADHLDNQYQVKLNDKACVGKPRAPFSKTTKGTPSLRILGSQTPYKLTKGS